MHRRVVSCLQLNLFDVLQKWIMLAKARSDRIARRAALSAPTRFLPRLLLCSGLPRASLVTMIDRLGQLSDLASDKDQLYEELLVSSTSSEWDFGRGGGHGREIARKLLGRLAAYTRLNALPVNGGDSEISLSFLKWLSHECQVAAEIPKKQAPKKKWKASKRFPRFLETTASSAKMKDILSGEVDVENVVELSHAETTTVTFLPVPQEPSADSRSSALTKPKIESGIKGDDAGELEECLNTYLTEELEARMETQSGGERLTPVDVCLEILRCYMELEQENDRAALLVLKWVPLLLRDQGSHEFWRALFSKSNNPSIRRVLDDLVSKCVTGWDDYHVQTFVDWMVSVAAKEAGTKQTFCARRIAYVLVLTSGSSPSHLESLSDFPDTYSQPFWRSNKDTMMALISIAIGSIVDDEDVSEDSYRRNGMPPSSSLLLQIAGTDRETARGVVDSILEFVSAIAKGKSERLTLEAILLRIYLRRPPWMQLGRAQVRSV